MFVPDRPGTVGRFVRRPTTDRGRMTSSKALLPRAANRTHFALLVVLDGAVAVRQPLPLSTWYGLKQRDWRIASTKHANSYLFRADRGEDGGAGICTPATVGACCGDSTTRAWYVAATKPAPWIAVAGFKQVGGRLLLGSLDSWARREAVLIPGKVSGGQWGWKTSIEPALVAALPVDTWCVARWNPATRRLEPRPAAGGAACMTAACDLQRYTLDFDPTTDVLVTDQVGTALLLLADVTISQIGPEIASGQCVRSGSAGVPPPPPAHHLAGLWGGKYCSSSNLEKVRPDPKREFYALLEALNTKV